MLSGGRDGRRGGGRGGRKEGREGGNSEGGKDKKNVDREEGIRRYVEGEKEAEEACGGEERRGIGKEIDV